MIQRLPLDTASADFLKEAQAAVESRFPLISRVLLAEQNGLPATALPAVAGLIAAILESADKPCCLVMPDHRGVALAVGTLLAVSQLHRAVPEILRAHANASFQIDDRVLVHPSGLVYEYRGFFCPEFFRLKVINKNESRSLPVREVARLEKTSRKMPKGYLNSDLGRPEPTVLGTLVGIPGTVNRNFLRNYVAILGSKKLLRDQLERWTIAIDTPGGPAGTLGNEVPFGEVNDDATLGFFDRYVASGEPLVAVASSPDELAAFCAARGPFTTSVILDDVERLARNLHACDAIADSQRMVLLASDSQYEAVRALKERCVVWQLSPEEVLLGAGNGQQRGPLKGLLNKAFNMRDLVVSPSPCADATLDEVAADLSAAAKSVPTDNDNSTVRDLFLNLFGTLMFCAEYLGSTEEAFVGEIGTKLKQVEGLLKRAEIWFTPEVAGQLRTVITRLHCAAGELSGSQVTPKGRVLLESVIAAGTSPLPIAVVTRSEARRDEVHRWLTAHGHPIPVYRITEVPSDGQFEQLVVVSWPSARRFDRLLRLYATQRLQVLAYSFERLWLRDYSQRYLRSAPASLTTRRKSLLVGLAQAGNMHEESPEAVPAAEGRGPFDLPEERFLIRRKSVAATISESGGQPEELAEAYYVDFVGPTFGYFTEGHELPVVNEYVAGNQGAASKVPFRSIEDLRVGDFVLFRETGDSDIIRFMVEDEIGVEAYRKLRAVATRWKSSLRKIGRDPAAVWDRLRPFGFSRHIQTLRSWLMSEYMIAPKNLGDIGLIARASDDRELLDLLPEIENAISEINGHHIRAGKRLTTELLKELPKRLEVLGTGETELDLGFGRVWIVRVEEIDEATSQISRSLVNRLLWDSEYVLQELLS